MFVRAVCPALVAEDTTADETTANSKPPANTVVEGVKKTRQSSLNSFRHHSLSPTKQGLCDTQRCFVSVVIDRIAREIIRLVAYVCVSVHFPCVCVCVHLLWALSYLNCLTFDLDFGIRSTLNLASLGL